MIAAKIKQGPPVIFATKRKPNVNRDALVNPTTPTTPETFHHHCRHCRQALPQQQPRHGASSGFCCPGCQTAHQLITELGLAEFYQRSHAYDITTPAGNETKLTAMDLYDEPVFQESFCHPIPQPGTDPAGPGLAAHLQISGLSCYGCVWLLKEAVTKRLPGSSFDLSLSSGQGVLSLPPQTSLSSAVTLISNLGYEVAPQDPQQQQHPERRELIRLGINGFCALNVMTLALPDHLDPQMVADFSFWQYFRYLSLALTAIVATYGSYPFYAKSWQALKQRRVVIDQPLSMAIAATFMYSCANTISNQPAVYFDSVALLVLLLGISRYVQGLMIRKAESQLRGPRDHSLRFVRLCPTASHPEQGGYIPLNRLQAQQAFRLLPGESSPVQAEVVTGSSHVHYAQITGEPEIVAVHPGDVINAGACNQSATLTLKACEAGSASVIAAAQAALQRILSSQGRLQKVSDRLAAWFFAAVLTVCSFILISVWRADPSEAIHRTIAALLVACPCAFATAVPLAMTLATIKAWRAGVVIKTQSVLESLAAVRTIYFDKTGTLTVGNLRVATSHWLAPAANRWSPAIISKLLQTLAVHSQHHVPRTLGAWAASQIPSPAPAAGAADSDTTSAPEISAITEALGQGMRFQINGYHGCLGPAAFCGLGQPPGSDQSGTFLVIDGQAVLQLELCDEIAPTTSQTIAALRATGHQLVILSGDQDARAQEVGRQLGFPRSAIYSQQSLAAKAEHLKSQANTPILTQKTTSAMVGDGFNDCLALAQSSVGIAVAGANQVAKDAADIYLLKPGIKGVHAAITIGRQTRRSILTAFAFALGFNTLGLSLAAGGAMSPTLAAILMPCGSFVVISIASGGLLGLGTRRHLPQQPLPTAPGKALNPTV